MIVEGAGATRTSTSRQLTISSCAIGCTPRMEKSIAMKYRLILSLLSAADLAASGDMNIDLLDALEDFIKRTKRRLKIDDS